MSLLGVRENEASDDYRSRASRNAAHGRSHPENDRHRGNTYNQDDSWRGDSRRQQHQVASSSAACGNRSDERSNNARSDRYDDPDGGGGRSNDGYSRNGIGPGDRGAGRAHSRGGGHGVGGAREISRERHDGPRGSGFTPTTPFQADLGAGGGWGAAASTHRLRDGDQLVDRQRHQEQRHHSPWQRIDGRRGAVRGDRHGGTGNGDGAAGGGTGARYDERSIRGTGRPREGGDADRGAGGAHGEFSHHSFDRTGDRNSFMATRSGDRSGGGSRDIAYSADRSIGPNARVRNGERDGSANGGARLGENDRDRRVDDSRGRQVQRNDSRDRYHRGNGEGDKDRRSGERSDSRDVRDRGSGYSGQRDRLNGGGRSGGDWQQRRNFARHGESRDGERERDREVGHTTRDRDRAGGERAPDHPRDRSGDHDLDGRRSHAGDHLAHGGYALRELDREERRRDDSRGDEIRKPDGSEHRYHGRDRHGTRDDHRAEVGGRSGGWGRWNNGRSREDRRSDSRGRYTVNGRAGRGRDFAPRERIGDVDYRRGTNGSRGRGVAQSGRNDGARPAFGIRDGQWIGGGTLKSSTAPRGSAPGLTSVPSSGRADIRQHGDRGRLFSLSSSGTGPVSSAPSAALALVTTTLAGDAPRRPRWDKVAPGAVGGVPTNGSAAASTTDKPGVGASKRLWGGGGGSSGSNKRPLWTTASSPGSRSGGQDQGTGDDEAHAPASEVQQRWQEAAAALGPAERQAKFLRLLGAKGAATAAVTTSANARRDPEDHPQPEGSVDAAPTGAEGGATGAHKVMQDLEIHYQKAHRAHFGCQRGLGN